MEVPVPKEKWTGSIGEMELGTSPEKGDSRGSLRLGGNKGLPFLSFEDPTERKVALAGFVADSLEDVPLPVKKAFGEAANDPVNWAMAWKERGADLICLHLTSTNPEEKDVSPEEAAATVMRVLKTVELPLIVYGSGHPEKDAKVLEKVGEAAKGSVCCWGRPRRVATSRWPRRPWPTGTRWWASRIWTSTWPSRS